MKSTKRFFTTALGCVLMAGSMLAQSWPVPGREAKAGTRWWWLGSAVDKDNIGWSLRQYANHGIGAVEITPLYGVQGNQANNIEFLSDRWFEMLREVQGVATRENIEVGMATGTGWPFGGPWVPLEESACKAVFVESDITADQTATDIDLQAPEKERRNAVLNLVMLYSDGTANDITSMVNDGKLNVSKLKEANIQLNGTAKVVALYIKYGVMKVKRAAPGGEGLVIDHFDHNAVKHYLEHISDAFDRTGTPYPHTFFNDSYEVDAATWTPTLLTEFEKRRGYKLQDHLPELIAQETKVTSDYRETLGDLILENFTEQWTEWAHAHGAITRNQAHGSPANLIDCYAAVDIPEIEGFGLSNLGIKGLRTDPGKTRKNDSDYSMFKYAPSAAHICGKPYTSSETFTWLTEHFRTSLSQLKPDLDLMFCAGVNHMFFHGTCYSPRDDEWPGWKFYASIDMSPTNSIWRDAPFFMEYVERCQSFLQMGQPDNDFLVLVPVRDMWKKNIGKLLMQFSIHAMGKLAPEFRQAVLDIDKAGFDCDYISERLLMKTTCNSNGQLVTEAGTRYKGLVIIGSGDMPQEVKSHINKLKEQGANIMYGIDTAQMTKTAKPEQMKTAMGLNAIRRSNTTGYHYFIANLTPNDINGYVSLAVPMKDARWFNPLNGEVYAADINSEGKLNINLRSGESMILQTFNQPLNADAAQQPQYAGSDNAKKAQIEINGKWTLTFTDETPAVDETFTLDKVQTWEGLNSSTAITMGTGVYTTNVKLSKKQAAQNWAIDLGDVRESARVYINGQFIGCAWSVPFTLNTAGTLKEGNNEIRIEVTNLPANRIAELDRQGVKWRKMEEINVVDINYKKTLYDQWDPMPSGLASQVRLVSIK